MDGSGTAEIHQKQLDMELIRFDRLRETLEAYGEEVRNLYQDNLITHDRIASGGLLNSVDFEVTGSGQRWEVTLSLLPYWKYVEYDTRPHWPPLDKILEWIRIKPVIPRPDKNNIRPTERQLAFLIGRAMAGLSPNQKNLKNPNGGTTGTHDLQDALDEINAKYREKIVYAIAEDGQTLYRMLNIRGELEAR
jgi:hypothetical protein